METNSRTGLIVGAAVVLLALVGGGLYFASQSDTDMGESTANQQTTAESQPADLQTIVDAASANENFSTLVAAVKAANLVETLSGEGPFTVFAPTNAAFDKLPEGTLDSLLLAENKETLKSILTYHVVSGEVLSSQLSDGQVVTTVNGADLTVEISEGMVYLVDAMGNRATVTQADIKVDNGVIHAIDTVVMPQ